MVKNKKLQKIENRCVFCGGSGSSKEHLWPKWIDKYCKDTYASYTLERLRELKPMKFPDFLPNLEKYNVKLDMTMNFKVKPSSRWTNVVCSNCNNGWMSRLEAKAEKILGPIFSENVSKIEAGDVDTVCAWIALRVMVMEFEDPDSKATKHFEHEHIYRYQTPPPHWKFWIGVNKEYLPRRKRQAFGYIPSMGDYQDKMDTLPLADGFAMVGEPNTRFTNIQVGHIVLLSYSSSALWEFPIELPFSAYFKELNSLKGEAVSLPILQTPPILAKGFSRMTMNSILRYLRR